MQLVLLSDPSDSCTSAFPSALADTPLEKKALKGFADFLPSITQKPLRGMFLPLYFSTSWCLRGKQTVPTAVLGSFVLSGEWLLMARERRREAVRVQIGNDLLSFQSAWLQTGETKWFLVLSPCFTCS